MTEFSARLRHLSGVFGGVEDNFENFATKLNIDIYQNSFVDLRDLLWYVCVAKTTVKRGVI